MKKKIALAVLMTAWAVEVFACTVAWDADRPLTNEVVSSANGRYCAVVRWYERIPDFRSVRAGDYAMDDEKPAPNTVVVATYDRTGATPRLLAETAFDHTLGNQVLVSDSGRYVAFAGIRGTICAYSYSPIAANRRYVAIADAVTGASIGTLTAGELFDADDLDDIDGRVSFVLRKDADGREVLVLSTRRDKDAVERRVDLASATLIDEKRPLFPKPTVFVTDGASATPRTYELTAPSCAGAFDDPALVRLPSSRVLGDAVYAPLPAFPSIAIKARIRGVVRVDVIVSEDGSVVCARSGKFVFGIDAAALAAVKTWRFAPVVIDGKPVKFIGELLFHFEDVDPDQPRM